MKPWTRWAPAVVVAGGAAVATAHGLIEVAIASRVPDPIAWLYPGITDGLALVAYAATRRLSGGPARYAWSVVVLSAALSGLAQAAYLAMDSVDAAALLRFGVGAWPAVACALVAHLLHLIVVAEQDDQDDQQGRQGRQAPDGEAVDERTSAPPAPALLATPAATHESDAVAEPTSPAVAAGPATGEPVDPRVVALARRLDRGEDLTGPAVAAELGLGERSGRRLLADARTHLEQDQTARPGGLHLVTQQENGA